MLVEVRDRTSPFHQGAQQDQGTEEVTLADQLADREGQVDALAAQLVELWRVWGVEW